MKVIQMELCHLVLDAVRSLCSDREAVPPKGRTFAFMASLLSWDCVRVDGLERLSWVRCDHFCRC